MSKLVVVGELASLSTIADYIKQLAQEAGLDTHQSYNLRLAVDEVSTNIVLHGYGPAEQPGWLEFDAILTPQQLTVILEDTGVMYDPRQLNQCELLQLDLPLEQRPPGGLGIYLAMRGVDEFHYERLSDRNRTRFIVNRIPQP
ncbi:MAG: anti-sigma regulatory factor [Cyanobacteria bacterium P01_G01_bin.54]